MKWDLICKHVSKNIPNFKIEIKEKSSLMRILSYILFFNKRFRTQFITTIYPVVYFPKQILSNPDEVGRVIILSHEYVHLKDKKRLGILFDLLYLSPQIFSLLAVLAIWFSNDWLWFLLFLLPLPSPRAYFEFRAYKMSIAVHYFIMGKIPLLDFYINQFTSSNYYWMFPFQKMLYKHFFEFTLRLRKKQYEDYIEEIKNVINS